ncbi:MAG: cell division protein SepF [Clostridiales bacterium]|nr:cell division protein SepF [Clostridiales bacterium]
MDMFRKISQWVTDRSDSFIRGGQNNQPEPEYEPLQATADASEVSGNGLDPFGDGDRKYGGRQPYRSREDLEAEAERKAAIRAQQEAEAYQAQLQAQQEQMQQTGVYPQEQLQYQQEQYAAQQQAQYQQEQYAAQQQAQYQQQMQYQQEQQYTAQQGYNQANVIPFPGMQSAADGSVYAHVEYIVQLTSRNECRTVIDYIRTNASVFLNMEAIENPSERQRCVDMLSGAAYALGCALNRISPRGVYLISSPSVRVMMDSATQKLASSPEVRSFARQSYEPEQVHASYTARQTMPEEPVESVQSSGFSSGSPTQRFQSQGAQGMPMSFSTAMAGSLTSTYRAVQSQRYNAQ